MKLIKAIAAYERQRERAEGWAAYIRALQKDTPEAYTPQTLTGDAWRAAMDKADAATDVALDAIY